MQSVYTFVIQPVEKRYVSCDLRTLELMRHHCMQSKDYAHISVVPYIVVLCHQILANSVMYLPKFVTVVLLAWDNHSANVENQNDIGELDWYHDSEREHLLRKLPDINIRDFILTYLSVLFE